MKLHHTAILALGPLLALIACEKPEPMPSDQPLKSAVPEGGFPDYAFKPPTTITLDRVTFDVPGRWTVEPPANTMRAAQFRIPASAGADDAVVAVFRGIKGGAAFNIARWESQFVTDDKQVETIERDIENAKLYLFTGSGTFDGGMAMGSAGPQPDMMVFGVLIEIAPEQSVYIKATGPRATLEPARDQWNTMVDSITVAPATP